MDTFETTLAILFIVAAVINSLTCIKENNMIGLMGWGCSILWCINTLLDNLAL